MSWAESLKNFGLVILGFALGLIPAYFARRRRRKSKSANVWHVLTSKMVSHPRYIASLWQRSATHSQLCLPLIRPIGSRRTPAVFVMESTHAWHLHHPALARGLRTPRLGRIFGQR